MKCLTYNVDDVAVLKIREDSQKIGSSDPWSKENFSKQLNWLTVVSYTKYEKWS